MQPTKEATLTTAQTDSTTVCEKCPECNRTFEQGAKCPQCDSYYNSGGLHDQDDTTFGVRTPDGTCQVSDFCSTRCMIDWLLANETHLAWYKAEEVGLPCIHCEEWDTPRTDPNKLYFGADGFYGSPVDGGAAFCSVKCAVAFFEKVELDQRRYQNSPAQAD